MGGAMWEAGCPILCKFRITSGLWAQQGRVGNSKVIQWYGSMMKATSWEQNGQLRGDTHSTVISGWGSGSGCGLGKSAKNLLTNLKLWRCDGFAFFGAGGGGGSLAAILGLLLRGGLTSLIGGVVGDTGGGGANKVEGSDRAIVLEDTGDG